MTAASRELLTSIGGAQAMGAMLRLVRLDRQLSRAQLARRTQWSSRDIARYECAEVPNPTLLVAARLARGCEVSISLLVASFALPTEDPLPWPREHRSASRRAVGIQPSPAAFGATLRQMRLRRNWSQEELAARAGAHPTNLSRIERGNVTPMLLTVTRLGRAFASNTPGQLGHITRLAQSYAGEIPAPKLHHLGRDRIAPRAHPD